MDFLFVRCEKTKKNNIITETLHLYYGYVKNIDFYRNKYKI